MPEYVGQNDLPMDVGIPVTNSSDIALEMADIDGIEPYLVETAIGNPFPRGFQRTSTDDGHVESDISLSQAIANEVGLVLQQGFNTVKGVKQRHNGILICFLALRKTSLVNAIYNDDAQQNRSNFQRQRKGRTHC